MELLNLDATAMAQMVKDKEITAPELLEAVINRIDKVNSKVNAVVTPMYEQARLKAALPHEGPFSGVPFLMKDLEFVEGARYTGGSRFLREFHCSADSELANRIHRAGFITIGKTNTCEFGIQPITEPELFGATRNPWNLEYTAGGSSGGAAAAVASGMVPLAHASDGGGSIRIPASCCGIFGMKTSRGRNPKNPDVLGLGVSHCVSRTVRDSAALLDNTYGSGLGDPYLAPLPIRSYAEEVLLEPKKLRIALLTTTFDGNPIHPDCVEAVEQTARLCESLGHHVELATPEINVEEFTNQFTVLWYQMVSMGLISLPKLVGREVLENDVEQLTWEIAKIGETFTGVQTLSAVAYMQQLAAKMAMFFQDYDVFLTPTLSAPPVKIGDLVYKGDLAEYTRLVNEWVPYTPLANATGIPAMSVPLYWNKENLPIGSQFFAKYGDEATLFRLAAQLERAKPWSNKFPEL
ncbi:6-aminohexanoate-cyclic-dimer hydrolase [Bacillus sp. THAF10]|uniref:amidase n=1 Tax=Bacillus sp. THAF10 TaxID=2587848 RepID=UPI0012A80E10|nr:amidase [Bacillus sp. THAF10]QFT89064.1 6-aminohexanoate-cyclic-dimer hydrolase [Bacillus sp. THAF10]